MISRLEDVKGILHSKLGLSPYESRAYVALLTRTSLEPSELTSLTGIPRPRTYDVLRGLVSKGLVVEQTGRPVKYSAIDPKHGLVGLYSSVKKESESKMSHLHSVVDALSEHLGRSFAESRRRVGEEQRIWVSGTSEAVWAQFLFLKEHCVREYVGATRSNSVPPYRVFIAEQDMLDRGVKMRLIRPFSGITAEQSKWYRGLERKGFRFRESNHVEFSFDVFDKKEVVLWLNDRPNLPPSEVAWIHHPPLARMLLMYFEEVWSQASHPPASTRFILAKCE